MINAPAAVPAATQQGCVGVIRSIPWYVGVIRFATRTE